MSLHFQEARLGAPSYVQKLVCTTTCLYKGHIYRPSFIQNSFVQYLFCTTTRLYKTWTYNTLFVQNLNLQKLVCTQLELTTPCLYKTWTYNTLFVQNLKQFSFSCIWSNYLPRDERYCCGPLEPTKSVGFHLVSRPIASWPSVTQQILQTHLARFVHCALES